MAERSGHPGPHPDLAGYLLGALEPDEVDRFEEHLASCRRCWSELAELSVIPTMLDQAAPPVDVPAGLDRRTFGVVGHSRRGLRMSRRAALRGAAAAVVLLVAVALVTKMGEPVRTLEVPLVAVADGGAGHDAGGTARITRLPTGLDIELEVFGLPVPPPGSHYECWYVADGDTPDAPKRLTGGTFTVDETGSARLTMHSAADPSRYPGLDITLEPDDGDPARKGPVVLVADTSALPPRDEGGQRDAEAGSAQDHAGGENDGW